LWRRLDVTPASSCRALVLGLGAIGFSAATALRYLGFKVSGWSSSARSIEGIDCAFGEATLDPLLARSNYVVAVLPETDQTIGLLDRRRFAAMKADAYLINVGRGSLVVDSDLVAALDAGHLSGACLDVVGSEPLPADSTLWHHPKILITPHTGGAGGGGEHMLEVAENYRRLLAGEPLINLANREKGY
jgi:glyoxylate/hydroxypyruvate reductase A